MQILANILIKLFYIQFFSSKYFYLISLKKQKQKIICELTLMWGGAEKSVRVHYAGRTSVGQANPHCHP